MLCWSFWDDPSARSHWDLWQDVWSDLTSAMATQTNAGNHVRACGGWRVPWSVRALALRKRAKGPWARVSCATGGRQLTASPSPAPAAQEDESGVGDDGFISFKSRFGGMPFCTDCDSALFYSYEVGPLTVVALSAYADISPASKQTMFLERALGAVNRTRTPWVLCAWHPPVYNSNAKHYLENEAFRVAYEPVLLKHRVNIVVTGHVHAFQRTAMVADNAVVDPATGAGIYHWMVGMGGKELYQQWRPEDFPWVAARDATFWGYAVLSVPNATHAGVQVVCANSPQATCAEGDVVDEFVFPNQLIALGEMPASLLYR
jgi:hypothetical protein